MLSGIVNNVVAKDLGVLMHFAAIIQVVGQGIQGKNM